MIPTGLSSELEAIAAEADRLHESALWSAQGQFEQAKLWRSLNAVLGVPAAVLAAVSGGTGLASSGNGTTPAILALLAAAFGATLTTVNASRRMTQAQAGANAYLEIQTAARQFLTVDLPTLDWQAAREQLTTLTQRRDEVNKTADPPGWYAYWRAKRNLTSGGQDYKVDKARGKRGDNNR
jgi:hypothetical protein